MRTFTSSSASLIDALTESGFNLALDVYPSTSTFETEAEADRAVDRMIPMLDRGIGAARIGTVETEWVDIRLDDVTSKRKVRDQITTMWADRAHTIQSIDAELNDHFNTAVARVTYTVTTNYRWYLVEAI